MYSIYVARHHISPWWWRGPRVRPTPVLHGRRPCLSHACLCATMTMPLRSPPPSFPPSPPSPPPPPTPAALHSSFPAPHHRACDASATEQGHLDSVHGTPWTGRGARVAHSDRRPVHSREAPYRIPTKHVPLAPLKTATRVPSLPPPSLPPPSTAPTAADPASPCCHSPAPNERPVGAAQSDAPLLQEGMAPPLPRPPPSVPAPALPRPPPSVPPPPPSPATPLSTPAGRFLPCPLFFLFPFWLPSRRRDAHSALPSARPP